jgi:hypothetical protein
LSHPNTAKEIIETTRLKIKTLGPDEFAQHIRFYAWEFAEEIPVILDHVAVLEAQLKIAEQAIEYAVGPTRDLKSPMLRIALAKIKGLGGES